MNDLLVCNGLSKQYSALRALDQVSLQVQSGRIVGLLGPNGSGKTTTINCLLSLLSYDKGNIEIFGQPMRPDNYDIKRQIGVVMQDVAVFNELTVKENIECFCSLYVKDKALCRKYVREAIEFVGLEDFADFYPKKLSGGLLRRLNIACGIAHKPKLIILDEPTVAVDPQSRNKILEGIVKLNEEGATIIYTSHYMEEVEQICTRIAIMDKGKSIALGTKEELIKMIRKSEIITIELPFLSVEDLAQIRALPHVYQADYKDHTLTILCDGGKHNLIRALNYLQEKDLAIGHVYSQLPTLNDVFLEITGKALRD